MKHTQGYALISSLVLLLVITLLSITSIRVAQMEQKMSTGLQQKTNAQLAAQIALKDGISWLQSQSSQAPTFNTCSSYPCLESGDLNADFTQKTPAWWEANSIAYPGTLTGITYAPRYLIEYITQYQQGTPMTQVYVYRITARGMSNDNLSVSMVQTNVSRVYGGGH